MYDPKSLKAEEFICHDEVMDSLAYADENKDNKELIRQILDKAAPVSYTHLHLLKILLTMALQK